MFGLYNKLLGNSLVYDQVRPRLVGGVNLGAMYDLLPPEACRVIVDIGCGTGDALRHLKGFDSYFGVDTSEVAIATAKNRYRDWPNVRFEARELRAEDIIDIAPTGVVLAGLLHHLSNEQAESVLRMAAASPRLVRIVTGDTLFRPGWLFNNVIAMMDRGRFTRDPDGYAQLARRAGLSVVAGTSLPLAPENKLIRYHAMALAPRGA